MGLLPGIPGTPSKYTVKANADGKVTVFDEDGYLIVGNASLADVQAMVVEDDLHKPYVDAYTGKASTPPIAVGGLLHWTTKEGKKMLLSEMEDSHLMNALFMTERNRKTALGKIDALNVEMDELLNRKITLEASIYIYDKNEQKLKLEKKRRQNAKLAEKESMLLQMRDEAAKHKVVVVKPERVGRRFRDDD